MQYKVFGDSCRSRARVFKWRKQFVEGREDVEDDPKTGRPSTFKTDAKIEKFRQLVYIGCRLTICIVADEIEILKNAKSQ